MIFLTCAATAANPVNVNGKLLTTAGFNDKEAETGGK